ncbi:MAG: hypothetical protein IIV81_02395, partial [Clostridia bacterium]|nr:hypothetical protein [Clostridia bacterium]
MDDATKIKEDANVSLFEALPYPPTSLDRAPSSDKLRPVICGFGPSGMFLALILARKGYRPIVFERGEAIEERNKTVSRYLETGILLESSNIQFGEGGAGAFSDGKLITRVNDKRTSFILKTLVEHGAPEEILIEAKPHVGTDKLKSVVKNIRCEIIRLGGEVHFNSTVTDIIEESDFCTVEINGKDTLSAPAVFIATGHSSHDTYKMLIKRGFDVKGKDFSVGVRIEHLREAVEYSMYGKSALSGLLPHAEYSVSYREGDRGVYSFCMCPGGLVMASASENESIVTNGMSYHARNEINSNSALAVSVLSSDYGGTALGAMEYQRRLERSAWQIAKNNMAPCQKVDDFLEGKSSLKFDKIVPTYPHGVAGTNLDMILPSPVSALLKTGLRKFARSHSFFGEGDAPLTGVETRTSSPVRISRDSGLRATGFKRVYPIGEGAGWAGGITSAALDGLRAAES